MSDQIRITPESLKSAGNDLSRAETGVLQALGSFVQGAASATPSMVGSEMAGAFDLLRQRLNEHLQFHAQTFHALGQGLSQSAAAYVKADQVSAAAVTGAAEGAPR